MTDKQKEELFNSIDNFDQFIIEMIGKNNLDLTEKIGIEFKNNSVYLMLTDSIVELSNEQFNFLIKELTEQKEITVEHEEFYLKKKLAKKRLNELTYLGEDIYRVEDEFYKNMYFAREIASAQGTYREKLGIIVKVLRRGEKIIMNGKIISSLIELESEMKQWDGFKSLEGELKK